MNLGTYNTEQFNIEEYNAFATAVVLDPLAKAIAQGLFSSVIIGSSMGIGGRPHFFRLPREPRPPRKPGG